MHSAPDLKQAAAGEEGSVTIEAALALSSLVVVSVLIIGVLATLASYVAAVDAAGAAARAHAIGEEYLPTRGELHLNSTGGMVTATVRIPVLIGEVSADAVFPVEFLAEH